MVYFVIFLSMMYITALHRLFRVRRAIKLRIEALKQREKDGVLEHEFYSELNMLEEIHDILG